MLVATEVFAQNVETSVDRNSISTNESITLTISVSDVRSAQVSTPSGDFRVTGRSTSSRFSVSNGRRASRSSTIFTLTPTRTGVLTIERIPIQTERGTVYTEPISITVGDPGSMPNIPNQNSGPRIQIERHGNTPPPRQLGNIPTIPSPQDPIMQAGEVAQNSLGQPFLVVQISDSSPYVGQQVVVDYLYYVPSFEIGTDVSDLSEPSFTGMWFQDITENRGSRRMGSQSIQGELYDVQFIRSYIAVPLDEGEIEIPSIGLEIRRVGFFRRNQSPLALTSLPLAIDVLPLPEENQPDNFQDGNVGALQFEIIADNTNIRVGDTLRLEVRASGISLMNGVILPHINQLEDMRSFDPDEDITFELGDSGWIEGIIAHDIAMVPEREGVFTIPSYSFGFFDPWTEQYQHVQSDPIEITVAGISPNAAINTEHELTTEELWAQNLPTIPDLPENGKKRISFEISPAYLAITSAPPIAFFSWLLLGAIMRKRRKSQPERTQKNAQKNAIKALKKASEEELSSTIVKELRNFAAIKANSPTRGLTIQSLKELILKIETQQWTDDFVGIIEQAELARYAGSDPESLAILRDKAIKQLASFKGKS